MKYSFKFATLTLLLCANAFATPVYQPPGANLTYGSSSNNQSIMSSVANPAAGAAVLKREDNQYRAGLITIGGGYEVGNVSGLSNLIDSTKTKLNAQTIGATCDLNQPDAVIVACVNTNFVAPVNSLLGLLQKDGNGSVFFGGHVPVMPLVVSKNKWGGSFVLDANVSGIANGSVIKDNIADITTADVAAIKASGKYTPPTNDSTLLVKAAVTSELGLGFSRSILIREADTNTIGEMTADKLKSGELTAGVRLKYYQVKLANKAQRQQTSTGGSQSTLKASQTYTANSGVGLDVGGLWTSRRYRVGAWVSNLNKPSFKYSPVDLTGLGYTNAAIINQLSTTTTYEMKPQLQMEGAIFSESQNWVINGGLDVNAVPDAVGREFQWMTLSAAYATNSWWIPGARLGYRSNRAGSKLSYLTGGLTLFKALSLDAAVSTDKVTDNNGKSAPRSAMLNLNLQMTF
ncbi:MAG: conjugal transfer protein TraF [Gallionella sp.]|nr:conjugal transfer protein TraF [Gallionella sp.]